MPMSDAAVALVERLFEAFNRRDADEIAELCDEEMEFFPVVTAEAVGRDGIPTSARRACTTTWPTSPRSGKSC